MGYASASPALEIAVTASHDNLEPPGAGSPTGAAFCYSGRRVHGVDLTEQPLAGADFSRADLFKVALRGADLAGASFRGASLRRVDLRGAVLAAADLRGAQLEDVALEGANLSRVDLRGASLIGCTLGDGVAEQLDLSGAGLRRLRIKSAAWREVRLDGAELEDVRWAHSSLEACSLAGASLVGGRLGASSLTGCDLRGATLRGLRLQDARLSTCDLSVACLEGVRHQRSRYQDCVVQGALFRGCAGLGSALESSLAQSGALIRPGPVATVVRSKLRMAAVIAGLLLLGVLGSLAAEDPGHWPAWYLALRIEALRAEGGGGACHELEPLLVEITQRNIDNVKLVAESHEQLASCLSEFGQAVALDAVLAAYQAWAAGDSSMEQRAHIVAGRYLLRSARPAQAEAIGFVTLAEAASVSDRIDSLRFIEEALSVGAEALGVSLRHVAEAEVAPELVCGDLADRRSDDHCALDAAVERVLSARGDLLPERAPERWRLVQVALGYGLIHLEVGGHVLDRTPQELYRIGEWTLADQLLIYSRPSPTLDDQRIIVADALREMELAGEQAAVEALLRHLASSSFFGAGAAGAALLDQRFEQLRQAGEHGAARALLDAAGPDSAWRERAQELAAAVESADGPP